MCTKRGLHLLSVDPKWTLVKADMFICSFKSSRVESTESNHLFDAGYIFMKLGCTQKDSQFQTLDTIGQWYMLMSTSGWCVGLHINNWHIIPMCVALYTQTHVSGTILD